MRRRDVDQRAPAVDVARGGQQHRETLGLLNLPSRPAPGSWWLDLDREAFRREVQTHAHRMHGSKEERQAGRYLTWDADLT